MSKLTKVSTKVPKPSSIYLCGASSKIKSLLSRDLIKTCFVRANGNYGNFNTTFLDDCIAIKYSTAFVFIMGSEFLKNANCLSLLGVAISHDIPVISIRQISYNLPRFLPKQFKETDIIDRSNLVELRTKNQYLATVVTLEQALQSLYTKSIVYHEDLHTNCIRHILNKIKKTADQNPYDFLEMKNYDKNTLNHEKKTEEDISIKIQPFPENPIAEKRRAKCDRFQIEYRGSSEERKPTPYPLDYTPILRKDGKISVPFRNAVSASGIRFDNLAASDETEIILPNNINTPRKSVVPNTATKYLVTTPGNKIPIVYHFPLSPRMSELSLHLEGNEFLPTVVSPCPEADLSPTRSGSSRLINDGSPARSNSLLSDDFSPIGTSRENEFNFSQLPPTNLPLNFVRSLDDHFEDYINDIIQKHEKLIK